MDAEMNIGYKFQSQAEIEKIFAEHPEAQQLKVTHGRDGYILTAILIDKSLRPFSKKSGYYQYECNKKCGWEKLCDYNIASDEEVYRFQRI